MLVQYWVGGALHDLLVHIVVQDETQLLKRLQEHVLTQALHLVFGGREIAQHLGLAEAAIGVKPGGIDVTVGVVGGAIAKSFIGLSWRRGVETMPATPPVTTVSW